MIIKLTTTLSFATFSKLTVGVSLTAQLRLRETRDSCEFSLAFSLFCTVYKFFIFSREKLGFPLQISYVNECGIDHGALRKDFLCMLLDVIEESIDETNNQFQLSSASCPFENDDVLSKENLRIRIFAFGVFCGIYLLFPST